MRQNNPCEAYSRDGKVEIYRTLDDQTVLNAALDDTHGFVAHGDGVMIIDEI